MSWIEKYEPFSEQRFAEVARQWVDGNLSFVRIVMGPLTVVCESDIFNSIIHIIATESGQVTPRSLRFHGSNYVAFRCIYGQLRQLGVMNWEWEMPNEYYDFDLFLYQEILKPYQPYLRVRYPKQPHHPLCIENLWSSTYMKIFPMFQPSRATAVYPHGSTTAWVDSLLNQEPEFSLDLDAPTMAGGHEV